jgi:hypothetical protein
MSMGLVRAEPGLDGASREANSVDGRRPHGDGAQPLAAKTDLGRTMDRLIQSQYRAPALLQGMFLGRFAGRVHTTSTKGQANPHGPMRDAVLPVEDVWETVLTMGFRSLHRVKIHNL